MSDLRVVDLLPNEGSAAPTQAMQEPAVPIERSIAPDYLVCLEDGKKFKCLQKHLRTHGLTPDAYRARWGLPAKYPMVAHDYSIMESEMRKGVPRGKKLSRKRRRPQKAAV
jgi:predicted transcriptional regulator